MDTSVGDKQLEKPPATATLGGVAGVGADSTAAPPPSASEDKPKDADKPKAKRTSLSLHEKYIVKTFCDQQISESKTRADFVPSHDTLRQEIAAKFGWELGRSTLSKIMCTDWQQLQLHAHPNPNMKRKRKPLFPAFEEDLVEAVRLHLARQESVSQLLAADNPDAMTGAKNGPVLTEAIILEEAQKLKQQHGIKDEELVLSVGWLARFKHRNGIRLRKGAISSGDGPPASGLILAVDSTESSSKRLKRNDVGVGSAPHPRWQSSFQFPANSNGIGELSGPSQSHSAVADLHANCSGRTTLESDVSGVADANLAAYLEAVPEAVRQFTCQHCSMSLPVGIEGLHVVVVGFNCIRDAFVAATLVGESGSVVCIETNPDAASAGDSTAQEFTTSTLSFPTCNLRIISKAALALESASADLTASKDLVIFNCSFHHAAHKAQLLELAFHYLQEGGECRLSYVSSSRRLTLPMLDQQQPLSLDINELVSTSVYMEDFRRMCQHIGFLDPRILLVRKCQLEQGDGTVANAPFDLAVSTYRLFKLGLVEDRPEDYGERATFTGGAVAGLADALVYRLDAQFAFMRDVSAPVDGNTSQILRRSWMKRVFTVEGDRTSHRGRFTYSL